MKTKLSTIKVLFSKALIDLNISHDEFLSVNNVLTEYNGMKENSAILMTNKKTFAIY